MRRPVLVKLAAALAACIGLAIGGVSIASGGASPAKPSTKPTTKAARSLGNRPPAAQRPRVETAEKGEPANEPAEKESEAAGETEGDSDSAAQAAACQKAGIDPNADNVEFDEQTGTCSIDQGGNSAD